MDLYNEKLLIFYLEKRNIEIEKNTFDYISNLVKTKI